MSGFELLLLLVVFAAIGGFVGYCIRDARGDALPKSRPPLRRETLGKLEVTSTPVETWDAWESGRRH